MNKKCYKCKLIKPAVDFPANRSRPDGLGDECKPCKAELQAKYTDTAPGREAVQKAIQTYRTGDKGREAFRRASAKYARSEHGKKKRREYSRSPAGKESLRKYRKKIKALQSSSQV